MNGTEYCSLWPWRNKTDLESLTSEAFPPSSVLLVQRLGFYADLQEWASNFESLKGLQEHKEP
jgi:hypothetical protein